MMETSPERPDAAKDSAPGSQNAGEQTPWPEIRVVTRSVFAIETDLPPWRVDLHPSGVLHAAAPGRRGGPVERQGGPTAHAFAWVADAARVRDPLARLRERGYLLRDIVFVPYSSRANWSRRYASAPLEGDAAEGDSDAAPADDDGHSEEGAAGGGKGALEAQQCPDAAKESALGQDADEQAPWPDIRVVKTSVLAMETDLPPWCVNLHPSGVLHAAAPGRREGPTAHAFVWVADSAHVRVPLARLQERGYSLHDIVFIPYSSRANWSQRYAQAALEAESAEGDIGAKLAAEEARGKMGAAGGEDGAPEAADAARDEGPEAADRPRDKKKGYYQRKNILGSGSFLGDAERDELHLEMWYYFRWLHAKLVALEGTTAPADGVVVPGTAPAGALDDDELRDDEKEGQHTEKARALKGGRHSKNHGVNLPELQRLVDTMEATFFIIPNVKREEEAGGDAIMTIVQQLQERRPQRKMQETVDFQPPKKVSGYHEFVKEHKKSLPHYDTDQQPDKKTHFEMMRELNQQWRTMREEDKSVYQQKVALNDGEGHQKKEPAPFLEEVLSEDLQRLVEAREVGGRIVRRSRKRGFDEGQRKRAKRRKVSVSRRLRRARTSATPPTHRRAPDPSPPDPLAASATSRRAFGDWWRTRSSTATAW